MKKRNVIVQYYRDIKSVKLVEKTRPISTNIHFGNLHPVFRPTREKILGVVIISYFVFNAGIYRLGEKASTIRLTRHVQEVMCNFAIEI